MKYIRFVALRESAIAQSGHRDRGKPCPLSGVKRTSVRDAAMSAYDPEADIRRHFFLDSASITAAEEPDIHAGLFTGLENGTLRPVVGKVLPLPTRRTYARRSLSPDRRVRSCLSANRLVTVA
jgi:hypothetical protein